MIYNIEIGKRVLTKRFDILVYKLESIGFFGCIVNGIPITMESFIIENLYKTSGELLGIQGIDGFGEKDSEFKFSISIENDNFTTNDKLFESYTDMNMVGIRKGISKVNRTIRDLKLKTLIN